MSWHQTQPVLVELVSWIVIYFSLMKCYFEPRRREKGRRGMVEGVKRPKSVSVTLFLSLSLFPLSYLSFCIWWGSNCRTLAEAAAMAALHCNTPSPPPPPQKKKKNLHWIPSSSLPCPDYQVTLCLYFSLKDIMPHCHLLLRCQNCSSSTVFFFCLFVF